MKKIIIKFSTFSFVVVVVVLIVDVDFLPCCFVVVFLISAVFIFVDDVVASSCGVWIGDY